jgi:hypothetical protein
MRAIDQIRELYVTEEELADLLNVDTKRIRDLRSNHNTGKEKFIDHIKPSGKCRLYPISAVMDYLDSLPVIEFKHNEKV